MINRLGSGFLQNQTLNFRSYAAWKMRISETSLDLKKNLCIREIARCVGLRTTFRLCSIRRKWTPSLNSWQSKNLIRLKNKWPWKWKPSNKVNLVIRKLMLLKKLDNRVELRIIRLLPMLIRRLTRRYSYPNLTTPRMSWTNLTKIISRT